MWYLQMNEMEAMRIDEELSKQRLAQSHHNFNRHSKDSGVVDIELLKPSDPGTNRLSAPECDGLKKNTLSNSLCDLSEVARRGSGGSLDSGMVRRYRVVLVALFSLSCCNRRLYLALSLSCPPCCNCRLLGALYFFFSSLLVHNYEVLATFSFSPLLYQ
jgi:hypothetical protein